jgi:hypothetical protein
MNEISIFIWTDDLTQLTDILRRESFYEINGAGRTNKGKAIPEIVKTYTTGRPSIPDYVKRTIVPDWRLICGQTKSEVYVN